MVWNEFFRDDNEAVRSSTDTSIARARGLRSYHTLIREDLQTGLEAEAEVTAGTPDTVSATDILKAVAEQKLQMRRETYGTRYIDILRSYGVRVNYQMLQRPEVIALSRKNVSITDVVGTGSTNLGDLGGHGIAGLSLRVKRKSFPEHGTLLGLMTVRPRPMAGRWISYLDSARNFEDYYDPGLIHLPPVEMTRGDLSMGQTAPSTVVGYHPWGEWYRREIDRSAIVTESR